MLLELLAAIERVDPTALPLLAIVVIAAGMYPLGVLLPCSQCCTPCGCPLDETLPPAVLVTLNGLSQGFSRELSGISLSFSSCFGSGAAGTVDAAGGDAPGPIKAVSLTASGSGYAVLGREEPTLSIAAGPGVGAEFSVEVTPTQDDCEREAYKISKVTVVKGGSGFWDYANLTVSLGSGDVEHQAAELVVLAGRSEPELAYDIDSAEGSGGELEVALALTQENPNVWSIDSVEVTGSGSGYQNGDYVYFDAKAGGVTQTQGVGRVVVEREQPPVVVEYSGGGTGVTFSPVLVETSEDGKKVWVCETLSFSGNGTGYATGQIAFVRTEGVNEVFDPDSAWSITASGGTVVAVTKIRGGRFWKNTDRIDSVDIENAGEFYGPGDAAASVDVVSGGLYYKENPSLPAIVADVDVEVVFGMGTGAVVLAAVDSVVGSPTFGMITNLSVASGGTGYQRWYYATYELCNLACWNGSTLLATKSGDCEYLTGFCCSLGAVSVKYNGRDEPPLVKIVGSCPAELDGPTGVPCEDLSFTASAPAGFGGTAIVEPAPAGAMSGDYPCPGCCYLINSFPESPPCTEEDCLASGNVWQSVCKCEPCQPSCSASLIVHITSVYQATDNDGTPIAISSDYTLNLNAGNGYSQSTPDYVHGAPGHAGARAYFNIDGNDFEACSLYVVAHAGDAVGDGGMPNAYDGFCLGEATPGGFDPAPIRMPFAAGCWVDGVEVDCIPPPFEPGTGRDWWGGAHITVTVVQ